MHSLLLLLLWLPGLHSTAPSTVLRNALLSAVRMPAPYTGMPGLEGPGNIVTEGW